MHGIGTTTDRLVGGPYAQRASSRGCISFEQGRAGQPEAHAAQRSVLVVAVAQTALHWVGQAHIGTSAIAGSLPTLNAASFSSGGATTCGETRAANVMMPGRASVKVPHTTKRMNEKPAEAGLVVSLLVVLCRQS